MVVRGDAAFAGPRGVRLWEEFDRALGGIASSVGVAQNAGRLRAGAGAWTEAQGRCRTAKQTVHHFDAFA
jgi:hypothetical protein